VRPHVLDDADQRQLIEQVGSAQRHPIQQVLDRHMFGELDLRTMPVTS
jgi:hypothetical protein